MAIASERPRTEPLPDNAPHVLVVDDDQRIRDLLSRFLMENGFRVTPAGDANAARSALRGLAFDLVILDVMMPGENGISQSTGSKASKPASTITFRSPSSRGNCCFG